VSSSLVLVRALLQAGDYLSIISRRQIASDLDAGTLVRLPVDLPHNGRPIGLTVRAAWQPTATQAIFLDCIRAASRTSYDRI